MKRKILLLVLASLVVATAVAEEAKVTPLLSKELTGSPGKEGLMMVVEYPPGNADPIHRHNAHGFIYVLEGSVVMQVKGGKQVTLTSGQTFYEGPDDVHIIGRKRKQHPASEAPGVPGEGQRRSGAGAGKVMRKWRTVRVTTTTSSVSNCYLRRAFR
jgi:quercetin dioxygenase-like cupin family protein